ncbi:MAG: PEP-CTERM sorting domain-containing protein [Sedimentisphaerales bacterium]|nr:PEP-CTERM sorting domain-containing protein [Sedimentisphaerales bacterium]
MMKKKVFYLVPLLLVLGAAGIASAITNNWVTGGTDDWNTPANWSMGHVPYNGALNATGYADVLNEEAKINGATGTGPVIGTGDVVSAYRVFVGSTGYGELTIDGGTLLTNGYMTSAYVVTTTSALVTMKSGTVQIGFTGGTNGHWYLGRYGATTFNMSGGDFTIMNDLNIGQYASGNGTVNLSGGTLTASTLKKTGTAHIDITGSGKLVLLGDDTAVVSNWIISDWMTGNGNAWDIQYVYNPTTNKTTVWVPEPATICMLGIGVFGLIRRK